MIDRRIKVRHVQAFVEITRVRSLKRAAERLHLTQPAISKTVKDLEEIVGHALLSRSRRGVSLTARGEVFLRFAERSLQALEEGLDRVRQPDAAQPPLRIGALPSVAARLMPHAVAHMATLAPEVPLRIVDGGHRGLIDQLRRGQLDLVIGRLGAPDVMMGLSFTQLYNEPVAFVCRPGHPLLQAPAPRGLSRWPVLFPPPEAAIRPLVERFLVAEGIGPLPHRIETVSGAFGAVYARTTEAIWIISEGVAAQDLADGRLVALPFDTTLTAGPIGLMTRPETPASAASDLFGVAIHRALADLAPPK